MKKMLIYVLGMVAFSVGHAAEGGDPLVLDKVGFQISSKAWVNTQTALLTVNSNITLTKADLVKIRAEMMENLLHIAKGEWHITQFVRSQDSSGLEKLFVQAEVRVDQGELTQVYQHAKSLSKPGANYEIGSIRFIPSLDDIEQVKVSLREQLYQQANAELVRMNKAYPEQHYTINTIVFQEVGDDVVPQNKGYQPREMMNAVVLQSPPSLSVSNELMMTAVVQAASNRHQSEAH